jgi:hypothetical protein
MKQHLNYLLSLILSMQAGVALRAACVEPLPIEVEVKQSAAVFRGRVTSLEALPDTQWLATFEVEQWWKGNPSDTVYPSRTAKVLSCGGKAADSLAVTCIDGPYKFSVGTSYVVFAFQVVSVQYPPLFASQEAADAYRAPPPSEPRLYASSCGRTATTEESAAVIEWLNANIKPIEITPK